MEKELNTFRYEHGRRTYRMAWIVEYCLFALGLSLAGFNIIFGIREGDLVTGIMLAIGWVILGVIELATIPMAGSFRLATGINNLYAGLGLIGLLFLSSFTVYEFNEISSEYMTRGARNKAVTVEKLEREIEKHGTEIQAIETASQNISTSRKDILSRKEVFLQQESTRHKEQNASLDAYYGSLLEETDSNDEFSAKNPEEVRLLESIKERISQIEEEIASLEIRRSDAYKENVDMVRTKNDITVQGLETKISDIESKIAEYREDKNKQIDELEGGVFRRKESKRDSIQSDYEVKAKELQNEKSELLNRISVLRAGEQKEFSEVAKIDSLIEEKRSQIEDQYRKRAEIEATVATRLDSADFKSSLVNNKGKTRQVYRDRNTALKDEIARHEQAVTDIESQFGDSLDEFEDSASAEVTRFQDTDDLESKIADLRTEINNIIEETAHQYEKTMYFRMASWFSDDTHTGFGKLPRREDYNKSLRYIFAPVGLFFGLASIVLAYLGTGFMFEESKRKEQFGHLESTIEENERLQEVVEELGQEANRANDLENELKISEETKKRAVSLATAETNRENAELRAHLLRQDALVELIEQLKAKQISNERDLVKAKQRVFEAVRSVPQSITITDEYKEKE